MGCRSYEHYTTIKGFKMELQKYTSTDQYDAVQISGIVVDPGTMAATFTIHGMEETIHVSSDFMHRNNPRKDDWFVRCQRGYGRIVRNEEFGMLFRPVPTEVMANVPDAAIGSEPQDDEPACNVLEA